MALRCCLPVLLVLALAAPSAAVAAPSASAAAQVVREAAGPRLQVVLTLPRAATARTRPRSVSAKVGGATLRLRRTAARGRSSTWRSAVLTGARAAALDALQGKAVRLTVVTRRGRTRLAPVLPAAPAAPVTPTTPAGPASPATPATPATPPTPPGLTLTRNDQAGLNAIAAAGDLKLERYLSSGATMEIARAFFYANGVFRFHKVTWNVVMGERCEPGALEGTWTFKEGHTFPEQGGGVLVKLGVVANGVPSEEVLVAANSDPSKVLVGSARMLFDVNPNMRDAC